MCEHAEWREHGEKFMCVEKLMRELKALIYARASECAAADEVVKSFSVSTPTPQLFSASERTVYYICSSELL